MFDIESGYVRNMVKEIVTECTFKRIHIHKNFAAFLTNLLLIDPNWNIAHDVLCSRATVENFVKYVMEELMSKQESPKVVTLKIQYYFACNLEYLPTVIQMSRESLKKKLNELYRDIIGCRKLETKNSVELLYKKMAYYMTLVTGLGNPTEPEVYAEALAALKSILKEDYLMEFIKLSKIIKKDEFQHFNTIVAGIRLYNRDIEMGGAGIANLPDLLHKAIVTIKSGIEETLSKIKEKSEILTFVIRTNYAIVKTTTGYIMEVKFMGAHYHSDDIDYMKDLLVFFKQYELIVKVILKDVGEIQMELEHLYIKMEELLTITHDSIYKKVAIPVDIVFPLFKQLWSVWEEFQNTAVLLKRITVIMTNLEMYATQTRYQYLKVGPIKSFHKDGRSKKVTLRSTRPLKTIIIQPEKWSKLENVKLEYLGFCPWTLLQTDGALIPGNPAMGIAKFNDKYYVFACHEAFQEFDKDPEMCVNSVLELARKQPHLIHLFHLTKELEKVHHIKNLNKTKAEVKAYKEKITQTQDHIVESHIDLNYRWNVWDLKRHALTMGTVSHCQSRAAQSNKTSSKNNIRTQTYATEKQVGTQTYENAASNVPKPSVFIYGLRDRRANQQFKIDLTLPYK